jgi:hypothetical protein
MKNTATSRDVLRDDSPNKFLNDIFTSLEPNSETTCSSLAQDLKGHLTETDLSLFVNYLRSSIWFIRINNSISDYTTD